MSKRPFHRTDRLGREIQEVLALALQRETREDVLRQVVVTEVAVTRDLSLAKVFYYALSEGLEAEIGSALFRAAGFLRSRVGQQVRMRRVPELRFVRDEVIDRARRVDAILAGLDIPPVVEPDAAEPDAAEPGR